MGHLREVSYQKQNIYDIVLKMIRGNPLFYSKSKVNLGPNCGYKSSYIQSVVGSKREKTGNPKSILVGYRPGYPVFSLIST